MVRLRAPRDSALTVQVQTLAQAARPCSEPAFSCAVACKEVSVLQVGELEAIFWDMRRQSIIGPGAALPRLRGFPAHRLRPGLPAACRRLGWEHEQIA
jgi:hypothetical protein